MNPVSEEYVVAGLTPVPVKLASNVFLEHVSSQHE
jgi:hypothetical protein